MQRRCVRFVFEQYHKKHCPRCVQSREIQEKLEENKIRHQVLKGAVMKHIYPRPEFREMGDIDIMIYEDSLEQAEKVVEELGFVKYQTVKHHEIFFKKPFLMLEMHWSLYDQNVDRNQSVYFKKQFRAEKKKDGSILMNSVRKTFMFISFPIWQNISMKPAAESAIFWIYISIKMHIKRQWTGVWLRKSCENAGY